MEILGFTKFYSFLVHSIMIQLYLKNDTNEHICKESFEGTLSRFVSCLSRHSLLRLPSGQCGPAGAAGRRQTLSAFHAGPFLSWPRGLRNGDQGPAPACIPARVPAPRDPSDGAGAPV